MSRSRDLAARGQIGPGTTLRVSRTFSEAELQAFADLTRDYNPVHFEPRWASRKGYAAPVCHGLLIGSMLCEPGGQIGWLASGMSFRFRAPVYPGDTITCELTILELDAEQRAHAACSFRNQHGELVLSAELWGRLPDPGEQALLGTMLAEGDPSNGVRD